MSLRNIIKNLLNIKSSPDDGGFNVIADSQGIIFYLDKSEFDTLAEGKGGSGKLIQNVVLRMLVEQGFAEELPNGYRLDAGVAAGLDDEQSELLELPPRFAGKFSTSISGHSKKSSFKVQLSVLLDGDEYPFQRKGPYLKLGSEIYCRLTPAELMAISAIEDHQTLEPEARDEAANLRLMALLQTAERSGMRVDLSHFQKLDVVVPDDIGVLATRLPDGSLELCPSLGEGSSPEQLEKRWSQIDLNREGGVIRIDNRVVLLEPKKMAAVKEVLWNKIIPAEKVEDFISTPSAFLDASLVNLDLGFSVRVLGVGKMQHMDFGQLTDKRRDWFATASQSLPPEALNKHIDSEEDIETFKQKMKVAQEQGADSVEFSGEQFDISEPGHVENVLANIAEKIKRHEDPVEPAQGALDDRKEQVTLLIKEADQINRALLGKVADDHNSVEPDWSRLARTPFAHQKEGINWMLNLLSQSLDDDHSDMYRVQGALLADDMGLGKTYMTLVMLAEYLERQKAQGNTEKPVLVVAPLSLLENWEQEIETTFEKSPFRDIKVLQAGRDLKDYRVKGTDRESAQISSVLDDAGHMDEGAIRYALHIGSDAGTQRLDMDRRLVLTTYQTLRDYQFSLCVIDWGVVVFDEAQNIKNPNTLQTRAAKGLKADFKLLATGTPVENSLIDFWCLMDTAQPGLLGSWQQFRERWIKPITKAADEERDQVRIQVGAELRDAVGCYMLRRIKEDQLKGLPEKFIRSGLPQTGSVTIHSAPELAVTMQGAQLSAYNAVLDDYRQRRAVEDMRGQALTALQQLRSVTLHPRLHEASALVCEGATVSRKVMGESAKLQILLDKLDHIRSRGEKVILFMVTKQLQRLLKIWLDQIYGLSINIVNGDTAAVQKKNDVLTRKRMIEQFESVGGFNIIIMSPVAAGVGLTVVGANHVVHLERHWNPAKEAQATDRVYRIGQTKDVYIHLPAVLHPEYDSFDVHLDRLLNSKLMLKDAVVTPEVVNESEMIQAMGF